LTVPPGKYDEGYIVYSATRILAGDVPYRDFTQVYSPGQIYALAGLFQVFGSSLVIERLWDTLARVLLACTVFGITSQLVPARVAAVPTVISTARLGLAANYGYPEFPALLFSLLTVLLLLRYIQTKRIAFVVLSGACVGLTAVFRQDYGFCCFVASSVTIAMIVLSKTRLQSLMKLLLSSVIGAIVPILFVTLFLMSVVSVDVLWFNLATTPIKDALALTIPPPALLPLPSTGSDGSPRILSYLHFIADRWLPFYAPLAINGLCAVATILLVLRRSTAQPRKAFLLGIQAVALTGTALAIESIGRADRAHLLPMGVPAVILITFVVWKISQCWRAWQVRVGVHVIVGLVTLAYLLPSAISDIAVQMGDVTGPCASDVARAGCVSLEVEQAMAVKYIRARTHEAEAIFVGGQRHDRATANDIMFYFLSQRDSPMRAFDFYDGAFGSVETVTFQEEVVRGLEARGVRYVVAFHQPEDNNDVTPSDDMRGSTLLDGFIRAHFEKVAGFGSYDIKEKRS
jgi:hypothetical protein